MPEPIRIRTGAGSTQSRNTFGERSTLNFAPAAAQAMKVDIPTAARRS
jgi:hypothetical protein